MRSAETFDVTEYARVAAELADPASDRARVLAAHALDEDAFAALDRRFQDALSRAMDEEVEGIPPLVAAYAEAFARACAALAGDEVISIERFAEATREMQRLGDPVAALAKVGITLADYLRANERWTRRMVAEPALFARYRARLR